jgi:hypothetical protein
MKIIKNKFFLCILFLLLGLNGYSDPPNEPCGAPGLPDCIVEPPGGPIDDHIFMLVFIALLFGTYIIYRHQQNKKTAA